ncbi:hypothetical protein [Glycomyces sp. NPDC048151]|uniref:hypothetical protein n=1 Tax=Glycomyces sp. NPDC048151 TaxID=3364002 RepID=UPI00371056B9
MDESNYDQLISDLEASPGIIAGIAMILIALYIFSSYARAKMKYRLAQLAWAGAGIAAIVGAWSYATTYLA